MKFCYSYISRILRWKQRRVNYLYSIRSRQNSKSYCSYSAEYSKSSYSVQPYQKWGVSFFGDTVYLYCVTAAADDDKVITDRDDDGVRV